MWKHDLPDVAGARVLKAIVGADSGLDVGRRHSGGRLVVVGQSGEPWTDEEVDVVVAAYLALLGRELKGERPNKAEVIRGLSAILSARNSGSIERKLQNISAVLDEQQHPWVEGYKPLPHYQRSLRGAVETGLGGWCQTGVLNA